jgi:hypothetical protein
MREIIDRNVVLCSLLSTAMLSLDLLASADLLIVMAMTRQAAGEFQV